MSRSLETKASRPALEGAGLCVDRAVGHKPGIFYIRSVVASASSTLGARSFSVVGRVVPSLVGHSALSLASTR